MIRLVPFQGLGDMTAPLCAAAQYAASQGLRIYSGESTATLTHPHVVVATQGMSTPPGFVRANTSSTYLGYAVVLREEAQRRGVAIVWDPWPGKPAGAVIPLNGAQYAADIASWSAPAGCREATAVVPFLRRQAGPFAIWGWLVIGAGVLVAGGAAYWFWGRRRR
jgi:hypothetical protein